MKQKNKLTEGYTPNYRIIESKLTENKPLRTVLYATLLVILKTRPFPESGPLAFLSFELLEEASSSSEASSTLHSCKVIYDREDYSNIAP